MTSKIKSASRRAASGVTWSAFTRYMVANKGTVSPAVWQRVADEGKARWATRVQAGRATEPLYFDDLVEKLERTMQSGRRAESGTDKWLVLYKKGGRIGSVPLTAENLAQFQADFWMELIQRDASGTEHWELSSPKKTPRRGQRGIREWWAGDEGKAVRARAKQVARATATATAKAAKQAGKGTRKAAVRQACAVCETGKRRGWAARGRAASGGKTMAQAGFDGGYAYKSSQPAPKEPATVVISRAAATVAVYDGTTRIDGAVCARFALRRPGKKPLYYFVMKHMVEV